MTTPCVIYARFSTDKQRETSIEDQARVCRARAETLGLEIIGLHADNGVSGSTPVAARPGGAQLLADALAGRFRVLLLEGLDRLSRTLVEQETIIRRLEHREIRIIGVADGYDSASGTSRKLTRGMRGLVNEIYIDDLRAKTHRGLCGHIERGLAASFGAEAAGPQSSRLARISTAAAPGRIAARRYARESVRHGAMWKRACLVSCAMSCSLRPQWPNSSSK